MFVRALLMLIFILFYVRLSFVFTRFFDDKYMQLRLFNMGKAD